MNLIKPVNNYFMTAYWYHIYPFDNLENIKVDNFVIKFTNNFNRDELQLHKDNLPVYKCKDINKDFVESIFQVTQPFHNNIIKLKKLFSDDEELEILQDEFKNGQYYFSECVTLEDILPFNWH